MPSILCAGTPPNNSFCGVDGFIFFGIADVDPRTFSSSDISAKNSFPKAQQTQVVPRDYPVMQECWLQKELKAPRLPKLNVLICKSQSNLLLQRLLHDIRKISVASHCLTTKRLLRVMLFRSAVFKKRIYIQRASDIWQRLY